MDFDESCESGEMKARAWLIGDRAGTLIGLYHRGVEFARIMCTTKWGRVQRGHEGSQYSGLVRHGWPACP